MIVVIKNVFPSAQKPFFTIVLVSVPVPRLHAVFIKILTNISTAPILVRMNSIQATMIVARKLFIALNVFGRKLRK